MNLKLVFHRLTHWEYWPLNVIYYPLLPVWLYLSCRARSFFFFNAANPSMKNGGMAMESKMAIYDKIPPQYIPKTFFVAKGSSREELEQRFKAAQLEFPCIAKPNIGMKAFAVEKVPSLEELLAYLEKTPGDFLVQEFIPFEKEVGIFFVRYPNEPKGRITGIVGKEFLSVTGDGTHTLLQLIKKDARSHLQLKVLEKKLGNALSSVPKKGEVKVLVPYGSHTRGAKFLDLSHRNSPKLEALLNTICTQVEGFYYGRLDILYDTFEGLEQGKGFSIIEVNGAGSEATHIYDPKHSLFFAWREIMRHWNHLCNISIQNHKKGYPYISRKEGFEMLRGHSELEERLKAV